MSEPTKANNQLALEFRLLPHADVTRAAEIEAAGKEGDIELDNRYFKLTLTFFALPCL